MKKIGWLLFLFFMLGLMLMCLLGKGWIETYLHLSFLNGGASNIKVYSEEAYFCRILWKRIRFLILLYFLGKLLPKQYKIVVVSIFFAVSFGILFGIVAVGYGIRGVAILTASLCPQMPVYGLAYYLWIKAEMKNLNPMGYHTDWKKNSKQYLIGGGRQIKTIVVVLIGIILEAYINPIFVIKMIKM